MYKLADFGTAHAVGTGGEVGGVGCISTEMYRAPELSQEGAKAKTGNDIWSLFVTMAVAMDTDGFRRKALYMTALRVIAVQEAADHPSMAMMSSMAKADPGERATAEEMLIKLFNGEGCAPRPKPKLPSNRVQKRKALSGALKTTAASQRREPYQTHQARRLAQQPAASETEEMREMVREAQRHNDEMEGKDDRWIWANVFFFVFFLSSGAVLADTTRSALTFDIWHDKISSPLHVK